MATGPVGKVRSPIVIILLSIITLSIYIYYWQYASFKEMKDYSGNGIGGVLGFVFAFFLGGLPNIFIAPMEVGNLYQAEGQPPPVSAMTGFWFLLPIIGEFILLFKTQGALNKFWEAHGATA